MDDKLLLANSLLEWTKESSTSFIEVADDELKTKAEKIGMVIPSPDLAIFKTIYAEVDKVNKNGVILSRKAVEAGLPTLIGKQINWEHDGAGRICGFIIDAKIEKDLITIVGVIFKSLFQEEFDTVKTEFADKKLFVSFEIWSVNPETLESVTKIIDDEGTRSIEPIVFHGCGLLLESAPACPNARVYKLLARKEEIEKNLKIEEIKLNEHLVYAELTRTIGECKHCDKCQCEGGEKIVEEIKEEIVPKLEISEETKAEEVVTPVVETKTEEVAEVAPEVVAEAAPISVAKRTVEERYITDEIPAADGSFTTVKRGMIVKITEWSDGKKDVVEEEFADVVKYSQAELDTQVAMVKADLEKTYNEQLGVKDSEIVTLKADVETKNKEITTIKTEQAKVIEEAEKDLGVGSVNVEERDKDIAVQERVTAQAFPVKK